MSRLPAIQTETANAKTKQLLDAVQTELGITPAMSRVLAEKERVTEDDSEGGRKLGVGDDEIAKTIKVAAREVEDV